MAAVAADTRLHLAPTPLWASGTLLAGAAAVIAGVERDAEEAVGYAVTGALLLALAGATGRRSRVAIGIGLTLCAVQPLAVIVTAWELTHQIPAA